MPAVRAADLRRVGLRLRDRDAARDERAQGRHDDALDAFAVAQRVRRVDDVVRRRAEMHEALRVVGHLRADDVHERTHVVTCLGLFLRDLLRRDAVRRAGDRVRGAAVADAGVGHRLRERALDPRLIADGRGRGEVWLQRLEQRGVAAVEAAVDRRDRVEAVLDGHALIANTFAAISCAHHAQAASELVIAGREDLGREDAGVRSARLADRDGRDRDPARHLHGRKERVEAAGDRVRSGERDADDRTRGVRGDRAREMGRAAGAADEHLHAARARLANPIAQRVRRAVRREHAHLAFDTEAAQRLDGDLHDGLVRRGAHEDAH